MNIEKLLEMQKELDEIIFKNAGISEYPKNKVILALLTELGELSNEVKSFKYWKKDKSVDRNKVIEEWADCFHFALSLENELKQLDEENIKDINENRLDFESVEDDRIGCKKYLDETFIETFEMLVKEEDILLIIMCIGFILDISLDEMEEAYLKKHKQNYKRQESGY